MHDLGYFLVLRPGFSLLRFLILLHWWMICIEGNEEDAAASSSSGCKEIIKDGNPCWRMAMRYRRVLKKPA